MNDIRMKIAAGATILGLGGLGGFALASNPGGDPQAAGANAGNTRPKPENEVIHRTIHVRPRSERSGPSAVPAATTPAPAPTAPAPAATVAATDTAGGPVSTGTSGSQSGSYDDDSEDEFESDDGYNDEFQSEDEDD